MGRQYDQDKTNIIKLSCPFLDNLNFSPYILAMPEHIVSPAAKRKGVSQAVSSMAFGTPPIYLTLQILSRNQSCPSLFCRTFP